MYAGRTGGRQLETVRYLTGKRVTVRRIASMEKAKPGFNDDWNMVSAWVSSLGHTATYEEARAACREIFIGAATGSRETFRNEKLLVTRSKLKNGPSATTESVHGRTRHEFSYTFEKWPATKHFRTIITMDDAKPSRTQKDC